MASKFPYPIPVGKSPAKLRPLFDYYYKECPGTLLPLLLLYLAKNNKLEVGERARHIEYSDEKFKYTGKVLVQFDREDAAELAKTDPTGTRLLEKWDSVDRSQLSLLLHYDVSDVTLQHAREVIHRHDEPLIGTLRQKKALFFLAQGLLSFGALWLKAFYQQLSAEIIKASWVYEDNYGYRISLVLQALLDGVKGKGFYPYAKLPFLAARLDDVDFTLEFRSPEKELDSAVAELLVRGAADKKPDCRDVDESFVSLTPETDYDLVFTDWKDGKCAFDHMLVGTKDNLAPDALVVGVIEPKVFFDINCRQRFFRERSVDGGMVNSVVLLPKPMNAVVVILRNGRSDKGIQLVNLYNLTSKSVLDWVTNESLRSEMEAYSRTISLSDLQGRKYSIGDFFRYSVPDEPGFKTIPLRKCLSRIEKTPSSLGAQQDEFHGYKTVIPPSGDYDPRRPYLKTGAFLDLLLTEPAYVLERDSIVFNKTGALEPRIVSPDEEPVLLTFGFALRLRTGIFPEYIVNEFRKDYMLMQLSDWSHSRKGIHSVDEILDLRIHMPVDEFGDPDWDKQESIAKKELNPAYLPVNFVVVPEPEEDSYRYRIIEYLGNGCFGLTYRAERFHPFDKEEEARQVVLKEFYLQFGIHERTERNDAGPATIHRIGTIERIKSNRDEAAGQRRFIDEAEMMMQFGCIPDGHIRCARSLFSSQNTNNLFFVMDPYENGDLQHLLEEHGVFGEKEAIDRFIIPLAKALNILHTNRIVHLDLKPDNVMIDDEGLAVLADLGISKRYDEDGKQLSFGEKGSSSSFAAPEECTDARAEFHPEMDIYSLGATFYWLLTDRNPEFFMPDMLEGVSEGTKRAITNAMARDPEDRTKNIMDFVHDLPGYEEAVFEFQMPVSVQEEFDELLYGDWDFEEENEEA